MEVIRIPLNELTPDPANAKDHPAEQVEQIKRSIEQFGNLDPIGVWGPENLIVEGHGRFLALRELGETEAECIRLDRLTDEERRAYSLVHNKLTMNSGFIPEALDLSLESIGEIDIGKFSKYGVEIKISNKDSVTISELDAMKEQGKAIYGKGLLLSEKAAAEKAAAEKAAAEKAAAIRWQLSDREKSNRQIVRR